ncbi:MAG: hypothetical protein HFI57_07965 [Lachnospiraceae bacterium]|nr:hypothetical protein [Lachnospiraceae bacterium]
MDETEVLVKLEAHEHEISSVKERVKDLETQNMALQDLAISVNRMAVSLENMLKEINKQGKRLTVLENVPVENGKTLRSAVITALAGGIIGAFVTAVIAIL